MPDREVASRPLASDPGKRESSHPPNTQSAGCGGFAVKINSVRANNRLKAFEVRAGRRVLRMPFARLPLQPTSDNRITQLYVDPELGNEGFTYVLEDGQIDSLHLDAVLDYNADPGLLSRLFLYELTREARKAVEA